MMKTIIRILALLLYFQTVTYSQDVLHLTVWEFKKAGTIKWYPATVPGTIHVDLLNNGLIEDPFYRLNENDLQWIDKVNWEYRTHFKVPAEMKLADKLILIFEGLDTYADVFLNGEKIHVNYSMFVNAEIVIKPELLQENNELCIYFKSPIFTGLSKLEEYGLPLPADNDQSERGGLGSHKVSVFTRKAGYHYGWDWGPRLVTSGIWRDVYLKSVNSTYLTDVFIRQLHVDSRSANLVAQIELRQFSDAPLNIRLSVNGSIVETRAVSLSDIQLRENKSYSKPVKTINIPFTIPEPELWWPNGHGDQPLYTIGVELTSNNRLIDQKQVKTGLRTIELVREPDKQGESFYFKVNGKPIFAKGANYIPNDVFLPRVDSAKYNYIISSAASANINMLRVWGGGVYEDDIFYELCDKYGILVWQDFMFACAMYPGNPEYLKLIEQEAEYNIRRLRNHASIALWCGNNEIEQAWAQYEESKGWGWKQRYTAAEREIIWKAYDTIFHSILPARVKEYNPEIAYWHSSPSAGMGKLANHTNTSGDMHYWGVWHGNEPITSFAKYKARFMSEYGFQSFPEFESVKKYTIPEDWDINSEVMNAHQRSAIGNQRIKDYMIESYAQPNSFEDQLYVGQLLQAEAIKIAIEAHRAEMPYCMGSLYWQLNDCWPVASWSGIDYYGRWKALHYFIREAFKQQIITAAIKNNQIKIMGISDVEGQTASLRVNLLDFNGLSLWNRSFSVTMPANSAKLLTSIDLSKIPAMQNKSSALLLISLVKNEKLIDSDILYLDSPKNLQLPYPDLSMYISQKPGMFELEITSKKLCKNLMLISEGNSFSFSDNFFDILPGETRVVKVKSDMSYEEFKDKLSYIHLQQVQSAL